MGWIRRLQERWQLTTAFHVFIVLVVFACTGTTVYFIKNPILKFLFAENIPVWARILYYILILPVYNILLLFYGFLFGQFAFFWNFEKKGFKKILLAFKKTQTDR